jgi:hypothetical protein
MHKVSEKVIADQPTNFGPYHHKKLLFGCVCHLPQWRCIFNNITGLSFQNFDTNILHDKLIPHRIHILRSDKPATWKGTSRALVPTSLQTAGANGNVHLVTILCGPSLTSNSTPW